MLEFNQAPSRMWRIVEGEALILDTESGNYYSVNPVGTAILKGLTEGKAVDAIVAEVRKSYPEAPPNLPEEVRVFAESLRHEQLDRLEPEDTQPREDEMLGGLVYCAPILHKYDPLHQVAAYSPDEL